VDVSNLSRSDIQARFIVDPTIIEHCDAWCLDSVVNLQSLQSGIFNNIPCSFVDMDMEIASSERRCTTNGTVGDFIFQLKNHPRLYLTEMYMRNIVSSANLRNYPPPFQKWNWFQTRRCIFLFSKLSFISQFF